MSAIRKSANQPQGPAFQTEAKAAAVKPEVAIVAKAKPVPSHTDAKGRVTRCAVKLGSTQCVNPGRHPYKTGFTCSTHRKSIAKGAKVTLVTKLALYIAPVKAKTA